MTKLEYVRLELDNHIVGLKISKSTGYWSAWMPLPKPYKEEQG